jgi:hypothetical protein
MFSWGESPDGKRHASLPVAVSMACTTFPVDADARTVRPSGEIAMWSDRQPSTWKPGDLPRARSTATTSLKLGLHTYR